MKEKKKKKVNIQFKCFKMLFCFVFFHQEKRLVRLNIKVFVAIIRYSFIHHLKIKNNK